MLDKFTVQLSENFIRPCPRKENQQVAALSQLSNVFQWLLR